LLAQAPPLDFPVYPHQPGNHVLIKTWKENKLEPAWEEHFLVLLTTETAFWTGVGGVGGVGEIGGESSHMGNEGTPPDQKEQWTMLSHPGDTRVTLKRLYWNYSFSFIWEMVCLSFCNSEYFSLNCWIWCMPDPSLWMPYVPTLAPRIFLLYVSYPGTHRDSPKGWTRPRDTVKTPISTIQKNQQSFNRLQLKLQLFQTHPSLTCKDKQCNPLRLVIENPWSMTWEPSIFCRYGLGSDVSGTDLLVVFELHLTPNLSQVAPRRMMEGVNLIKIHCKHICKCHNESPHI
jgi:hypothetical protein